MNYEAPRKVWYKNRDVLVFLGLYLLATQGLWNALTSTIHFQWWKQLDIAIFTVVALYVAYKRSASSFFFFLSITFIIFILLTAASFRQGVSSAIFNSFYYWPWLPFYILGKFTRIENIRPVVLPFVFWTIIASGIGILLQLYTPYFNWLIDNTEATELATKLGVAQRLGFIYLTSTLVLPTMVSLFMIASICDLSGIKRIVLVPFLGMALIPTGSLAGLLMFFDAIAISVIRNKPKVLVSGGFITFFGMALAFSYAANDPTISTQLDRITNNNADSVSNEGRLDMWREAMFNISKFDGIEHLTGLGLGATNGNGDNTPVPHGESSFFQAYLEGGIIGLLIRLVPFFLLARAALLRHRFELYVHVFFLVIVIGTAPLFGAFGVQCCMGYTAGLLLAQKRKAPRPRQLRFGEAKLMSASMSVKDKVR